MVIYLLLHPLQQNKNLIKTFLKVNIILIKKIKKHQINQNRIKNEIKKLINIDINAFFLKIPNFKNWEKEKVKHNRAQNNKTTCHQGKTEGPFKVNQSRRLPSITKRKNLIIKGHDNKVNPTLQHPKKGRVAPNCPQETVPQGNSQENQVGLSPPIVNTQIKSNVSMRSNRNLLHPQACKFLNQSQCKKGKDCEYTHLHFKFFHKTVKPLTKGTQQEINQIYDQKVDNGNVLTCSYKLARSKIKITCKIHENRDLLVNYLYSHAQQKSLALILN
ncbi:hypothetical protein ABPG72_016561 [Tetrahymena utriculariae]